MIRKQNIKSNLAWAFAGLYFFAFLFSANIHQHNGGYYFKDFQFKSDSKNFSQQNHISNGDDCLSCHFASAPVVLPVLGDFTLAPQLLETTQFSFYETENAVSQHFYVYLRGPPIFI